MEPKEGFVSTDLKFHGRDKRPTTSLEHAIKQAEAKGSKEIRVYGIPRLVVDPKTMNVYLGMQFSKDITEKLQDGTLGIRRDSPWVVDEETKQKMADKEKRRLKNSTKIWHKHK